MITFDVCGDGMDSSYYGGELESLLIIGVESYYFIDAIRAAGEAGLNIMPLAWTLRVDNQTVNDTSIPRTEAVIKVCYFFRILIQ